MEFRIPAATYRLQFSSQFRFAEAREILLYLERLGVTEIYASPIFKSRQGSTHGYDVIDPTQINPELGSISEFETLTKEIREHNLGLLLDIVPNHMGISSDNPFWMELLKNGRESRYAEFFDIDWVSCDGAAENKILLPVLGKPYGQALEEQEITLNLENEDLFIRYYETRLPLKLESYYLVLTAGQGTAESEREIDPATLKRWRQILSDLKHLIESSLTQRTAEKESKRQQVDIQLRELIGQSAGVRELVKKNVTRLNGEKGNPRSFDQLDKLLDQQVYRLAYWRTASDELNYRRFFDINTLIGVRVELSEVMEVTHRLILRLVQEGRVTGLRIDHIDGLNDPAGYLENLRQRTGRFYTIVEKILSGEETLPGDWPVYGTTGYEFAREVNNLFINGEGLARLEAQYSEMVQRTSSFSEMVYQKKKKVIEQLFYGEIRNLGCRLFDLASKDRYARDLTERDITQALIEMTAGLPVYRTYIRSFEVSPIDKRYLEIAYQEARKQTENEENMALDFLKRVFCLDFPVGFIPAQKQSWLSVVMKWQQLTGPVTAKGLEDTALYTHNRLISLNVIGASLQPPKWSVDPFHNFNIDRQTHWPLTMNATSTHDTKRSEDVQSRIDVLSERAKLWTAHLSWWRHLNYSHIQKINGQQVPDPDTETLLYQSLVGAWPFQEEELPEFKERFKGYMLKAVREAKVYTSWIRPNEGYEKTVLGFVEAILTESEKNDFTEAFTGFQNEISFYGAINSLSQTLLKITSPGIPDIYQGMELWNLSLVDPDNRRPVDFKKRMQLLNTLEEQEKANQTDLLEDILDHWQDGRVKLYLTSKALNFRIRNRQVFQSGEYIPLSVEGKRNENIVAFLRHWEDQWVIVAVPRLCTKLTQPGYFPLGRHCWDRDWLVLPDGAPQQWKNVLTGEVVNLAETGEVLFLAQALEMFPVALLGSEKMVE